MKVPIKHPKSNRRRQRQGVARTSVATTLSFALLFGLLLSQPAFAQAAASTADGITLMLTNIESWLTGGIARIVAVIAVILVGFAFLAGRATFGLLVTVIIGIFIVFSAGWFVSTITNGAITTQ